MTDPQQPNPSPLPAVDESRLYRVHFETSAELNLASYGGARLATAADLAQILSALDPTTRAEVLAPFMPKPKTFRILGAPKGCPTNVPWSWLLPYEEAALREHCDQSLERLNERGGLCPEELLTVLRNERWNTRTFNTEPAAVEEIKRRLGEESRATRAEADAERLRGAVRNQEKATLAALAELDEALARISEMEKR